MGFFFFFFVSIIRCSGNSLSSPIVGEIRTILSVLPLGKWPAEDIFGSDHFYTVDIDR